MNKVLNGYVKDIKYMLMYHVSVSYQEIVPIEM